MLTVWRLDRLERSLHDLSEGTASDLGSPDQITASPPIRPGIPEILMLSGISGRLAPASAP